MDFALSRFNMVEGQIKTNRVTDPYVLDAMAEVPRESFVPTSKKGVAYIDDAIEVTEGRFLVEPMVLARMLDAATLDEDNVVLDVGCATGYSTAVIAKIVNTVVGVEENAELAQKATATLSDLGVDNAVVVTAGLKEGYPKQGPYDAILFNGSITDIPQAIKDQLAEGGRLVVSTTGASTMSTVSVYTRNNDLFSKRDIMEAGIAVLPGFEAEKVFSF